MNGNKLTDHLQEVEQAAERYMDTLLPQLMKVSKITEKRSKANSDGTRIGFAFCSILIVSFPLSAATCKKRTQHNQPYRNQHTGTHIFTPRIRFLQIHVYICFCVLQFDLSSFLRQ